MNYGWRKYECGVELHAYQDGDPLDRLYLWSTVVGSQLPGLNRWESLSPALIGFVSRGLSTPHACAYSATKALELAGDSLVSKTWIDAVDSAEAYEFVLANLTGVWFGQRTPYLVTGTPVFLDILKKQQ